MSKIEWTDKTWNPIRARNRETGRVGHFCVHVSDGCKHCYAERMQPRFGNPVRYAAQDAEKVEIFLDEKTLLKPLHWKKPRMIFVCSMTDLFLDHHTDEMIDRIFAVMALCPQHTFQVLTKRAQRMREYMTAEDRKKTIAERTMCISNLLAAEAGSYKARIDFDHFSHCFKGNGPFRNIWLGVSVENQKTAEERIPDLLGTTAAVYFVSYEPALGPVDFTAIPRLGAKGFIRPLDGRFRTLDWIICGGESGPGARPMHPDWARSARNQCKEAGVAYFFKQNGEFITRGFAFGRGLIDRPYKNIDGKTVIEPWPPDGPVMARVGKNAAGRLLDGIEHNEYPARKDAP